MVENILLRASLILKNIYTGTKLCEILLSTKADCILRTSIVMASAGLTFMSNAHQRATMQRSNY